MKTCQNYWPFILLFLIKSSGVNPKRHEYYSNRDGFYSYPTGNMTTSSGYPVPDTDTQTLPQGLSGNRLMLNDFFMESMIHLTAERIPERVVHAKGTGAFGFFTVTNDLSDVCKADVFSEVGKKTPVLVRFSPTFSRLGMPDNVRDARGMAVKFYTKEGNYDFVGLDNEMFVLKDPMFFTTFSHTFHFSSKFGDFDSNSRWDFLTSRPESLHMFMRVFGDRGIPDGYRYLVSFGIHTFELINDHGMRSYARFRMRPELGIRNLTTAQARRIQDINFAVTDLYHAIAEGNFPRWIFELQIIPEAEVKKQKFDIFDVTIFWPEESHPYRTIGVLELNRNPDDQFADIEQSAFNPANLVPGIRGVDTLFAARALAYRTGNLHRVGINFNKIRVNYPYRTVPRTYNIDGKPPVLDNDHDIPNYYPNSFGGPYPYVDDSPPRISIYEDPRVTNFHQAGQLYLSMTDGEKCRLVDNIVESMYNAKPFLQERAIKLYSHINSELGHRIESRLEVYQNHGGRFKYEECEQL